MSRPRAKRRPVSEIERAFLEAHADRERMYLSERLLRAPVGPPWVGPPRRRGILAYARAAMQRARALVAAVAAEPPPAWEPPPSTQRQVSDLYLATMRRASHLRLARHVAEVVADLALTEALALGYHDPHEKTARVRILLRNWVHAAEIDGFI